MTLQTEGQISLNDVFDEFNVPDGNGLGELYRGGSYVADIPDNDGIPTSGVIALDDFYGARNGVPITLAIIGGGGGGAGGANDGSTNDASWDGSDGASSWFGNTSDTAIHESAGGAGGNHPRNSNVGTAGGASAYGPGGGRGNDNNPAAAFPPGTVDDNYPFGAGGGGGGGDNSSKNDPAGLAGNGGSAASLEEVTTDAFGRGSEYRIKVGGGGAAATGGNQKGMPGAQGQVIINVSGTTYTFRDVGTTNFTIP